MYMAKGDTMQYCPNCEKEIPDEVDFCPYCGARISQKEMPSTLPPKKRLHKEESQPVSQPVNKEKKVTAGIVPVDTAEEPAEEVKREPEGQFQVKTLYCPNCGKQIPDEVEFCPYCGAKVSSSVENEINDTDWKSGSESPPDTNVLKDGNQHTIAKRLLMMTPVFIGILVILMIFAFLTWTQLPSKKKCDLGSGSGCYWVGWGYENGIGDRQNYAKAREYYEKACNLGYGGGCTGLGDLYSKGLSVKLDKIKAREYYGKACDLGYGGGCYDLGFLYEYGEGVKTNDVKAREYYKKACDLDYDYACKQLIEK